MKMIENNEQIQRLHDKYENGCLFYSLTQNVQSS